MTTDSDVLLRKRFARSTPPPVPPDWPDVVRRSRQHAAPPHAASRRRLLPMAAALLAVLAIAGSAIAIGGSSTGVDAIDDLLNRTSNPPGSANPRAPRPVVRPVPGSLSEPLTFEHDGRPLTAIGYRSERNMICSALVASPQTPERPVGGVGCLSARLLRRALARSAAHVFASGGGELQDVAGFARADVTAVSRADDGRPGTIALSEPWKPEPWDGEPIRFFHIVTAGAKGGRARPASPSQGLRLKAKLADGRTVAVGR